MRAVRFRLAAPALGVFCVRFYRQRLKDDRERNARPLRECGAPPTGRTKYVEYRGAGRPAPHLYAAPGGAGDLSPLAAGSIPARRTNGRDIIRRQALQITASTAPYAPSSVTVTWQTRSGGSFRTDTKGTTADLAHTSSAPGISPAPCFSAVFPGGTGVGLGLLDAQGPAAEGLRLPVFTHIRRGLAAAGRRPAIPAA